MNSLDKQYQTLLQTILDFGVEKKDRTGTGTKSIFGYTIRHNMKDGFPLLTTKKMAWKTMVTELLWFLRGDTNIKYLVDNNCHIWDGDAYKRYVDSDEVRWPKSKEDFIECIKTDDEFAYKWGNLGPVYGKQWRSWTEYSESKMGTAKYERDQIAKLINDLKTNPDSRRLMVNAWNVGELDQMTLPPCHYGFQVYTRELKLGERKKLANYTSEFVSPMTVESWDRNNIPTRAISLMWNQRSVDTFLGLPFNIASYGLLLEIIAKEVNMVPDELIGNLGDTHLYLNHIEQAKEQIGRDYTQEEIQEHLQQSGMDALTEEARMEYVSKLPKRTREPYPLPTITLPSSLQPGSGNWDKLVFEDFYLNDYQSHPAIKAPLSN